MQIAEQMRRGFVELARAPFRAEQKRPDLRADAIALPGARRWMKKQASEIAAYAAWPRRAGGRTVRLWSMIQSPARQRSGAGRHACKADYNPARVAL